MAAGRRAPPRVFFTYCRAFGRDTQGALTQFQFCVETGLARLALATAAQKQKARLPGPSGKRIVLASDRSRVALRNDFLGVVRQGACLRH